MDVGCRRTLRTSFGHRVERQLSGPGGFYRPGDVAAKIGGEGGGRTLRFRKFSGSGSLSVGWRPHVGPTNGAQIR